MGVRCSKSSTTSRKYARVYKSTVASNLWAPSHKAILRIGADNFFMPLLYKRDPLSSPCIPFSLAPVLSLNFTSSLATDSLHSSSPSPNHHHKIGHKPLHSFACLDARWAQNKDKSTSVNIHPTNLITDAFVLFAGQ